MLPLAKTVNMTTNKTPFMALERPGEEQCAGTCNPFTQETEAGGLLQVQGKHGLPSELQVSQGNIMKHSPKKLEEKGVRRCLSQ